MTSSIKRSACLMAFGMWAAAVAFAHAQEASGLLVVKIKNATTYTHLSKRIQRKFTNAGFEWGIADGKMVFTLVGMRFVNLRGAHFTRFGTTDTVRVASGEYRISCVGFINHGGLFSDEKAIDRGAYVNADVMRFRIKPGAITTIEVQPIIRRQVGALLAVYLPDILVSPPGGGAPVRINKWTKRSIPWASYTGPLKSPARHVRIPRIPQKRT